jgi:hypothetical protein
VTRVFIRGTPLQKVLARLEVRGECWLWTGPVSKAGYAHIRAGDRSRMAHRVVYAEMVGPIPTDMTVDHLCFNPGCMNPDHLRLLTMGENRRRTRAGMKAVCVNGHVYDEANTYRAPGTGRRNCRICMRERGRRRTQRRRALAETPGPQSQTRRVTLPQLWNDWANEEGRRR